MVNVAPITRQPAQAPFSLDEVQAYVTRNVAELSVVGHDDLAHSLAAIDLTALYSDLEKLEREITAIEEELLLRLRKVTSGTRLAEIRSELHRELKPSAERCLKIK
jgi:Mg2+ and Co2+ transporter CorA